MIGLNYSIGSKFQSYVFTSMFFKWIQLYPIENYHVYVVNDISLLRVLFDTHTKLQKKS